MIGIIYFTFLVFVARKFSQLPFLAWQIDIGANFKYNYFIKRETWPYEIIWRPGPEFSLSVSLPVKQGKNIVVRDSWVRFNTELSPAHSLRSWIEDAYHAIQPFISAPARGNISIMVLSICNFLT